MYIAMAIAAHILGALVWLMVISILRANAPHPYTKPGEPWDQKDYKEFAVITFLFWELALALVIIVKGLSKLAKGVNFILENVGPKYLDRKERLLQEKLAKEHAAQEAKKLKQANLPSDYRFLDNHKAKITGINPNDSW